MVLNNFLTLVLSSKYLYACNKVPLFVNLVICQRRPFQIFGQFRGLFKNTNGKNWGFCIEKKGIEKTRMAKVVESCPQVTWAQKSVTKKRE